MKESIVFSRIVMLCCLAFFTALSAMASSPNNDVWQSHAQDVNQTMEASLSNQTLTIHLRKMERLFSPRM